MLLRGNPEQRLAGQVDPTAGPAQQGERDLEANGPQARSLRTPLVSRQPAAGLGRKRQPLVRVVGGTAREAYLPLHGALGSGEGDRMEPAPARAAGKRRRYGRQNDPLLERPGWEVDR